MNRKASEQLLEAYLKELKGDGVRANALAESVRAMWDYLVNTPGEQRPYAEFGKMLGIGSSSAYSRIQAMIRNGIIQKTAGRRGVGGGVGLICEWVEQRRASMLDGSTTPTRRLRRVAGVPP